MQNFFVGKCLQISQKLYGGDRVCKKKKKNSKSMDEMFSLLCHLQLSMFQDRPVRLVPCFVEVHHIFHIIIPLRPYLEKIKGCQ